MIFTEKIGLISDGTNYSEVVTDRVKELVKKRGLQNGMVLVFSQHTTSALMLVEHEAGILVDIEDTLEWILSEKKEMKHHLRGFDLNGRAHVLAGIMGNSVTIPVIEGSLALGTFQEILFWDFQPEEKTRTVLVQMMGE